MWKKEIQFSFLKWGLVLVFLNACICLASNCYNCCNSYTEINEPRRSVKSILKAGQIPLCDRLLPYGWYRFTSFGGTKMPETPITEYRCGTYDPIWLKDPHPTEDEGNVARRACISSFGNTCRYSTNINVKRCPGNYFVYFLKPRFYCATAYCAGKISKLPQSVYYQSAILLRAMNEKKTKPNASVISVPKPMAYQLCLKLNNKTTILQALMIHVLTAKKESLRIVTVSYSYH